MDVHAPAQYANYFSGELREWAGSFKNFQLAEFKPADSVSFYSDNKMELKAVDSFLLIYRPILTFSPDSGQFLDIYSGALNLENMGSYYMASPDDDEPIFLCNARTRYWNRVYCGSLGVFIEEVCWVSSTEFMMVGIERNEKDERRPFILVGDEDKQRLYEYVSTNAECVKVREYQSAKLNRMPIRGL